MPLPPDPEAPGPRCLRCGSDSVIPDARLVDRGDADARKPAEVGVVTNPAAWVFKGEVRTPTRAQVCGDCGFVEVYATDPDVLWQARLDRVSRDRR